MLPDPQAHTTPAQPYAFAHIHDSVRSVTQKKTWNCRLTKNTPQHKDKHADECRHNGRTNVSVCKTGDLWFSSEFFKITYMLSISWRMHTGWYSYKCCKALKTCAYKHVSEVLMLKLKASSNSQTHHSSQSNFTVKVKLSGPL